MQTDKRRGVTLIELLVVIGIIAALATMLVAFAPRFGERHRATRGAAQVQSWLNLAKQRALRDQRPVGIRLPAQINEPGLPTGYGYIRELQFIEVPDEYIGGTVTVPYDNSGASPDYSLIKLSTPVQFTPGDPTGLIQSGDVILIPGPGYAPRRIVSVAPGSPAIDSTVTPPLYNYAVKLDMALSNTPSSTGAHRVYRKARPVQGEPVLMLPKDIGIDISRDVANASPTWYRMFPPTANSGGPNPFDILFSPSGQVIGAEGALGSRICLWVRDVSLGNSLPNELPPGENSLITVYTRTGQISAHPVDPSRLTPGPNWNPFFFTQDGKSSGN